MENTFVIFLFCKNYAQTLVDADRTSLFLVDSRTNELYARIFDIGGSLEDSRSSNLQKEIRYKSLSVVKTYQLSERGCGTYAKAFLSNARQPEESPFPF